ncbi:MAG: DUF1631 family protein [Burkholderiaceae bacterium]
MHQKEQRRYKRMAARQAAVVRLSGESVRGEIRDFCQSGLYVAIESPLSAEATRDLTPAALVDVEFAVGARKFVVSAKVARALPTGVGLQTDALGADILAALGRSGAGNAAGDLRQLAATRPAGASTKSINEALHACQRLFDAAMNEVLDAYFGAIAPSLFEASDLAVGTTQRAQFGNAARDQASQRVEIAERFSAALRVAFLERRVPTVPETTTLQTSELTIVDDDQFEEWLSLSTLAHQIESDASMVLSDLTRRYSSLHGLSVDRSSLPFGPATIGNAFQQALDPFDYPTPVRNVMYRTFGAMLRPKCQALYAAMNEALVEFDVDEPASRTQRSSTNPPLGRPPEQAADLRDSSAGRNGAATDAEPVEVFEATHRPQQSEPAAARIEYSLERLIASVSRRGSSSAGTAPSIAPAVASRPARSAASSLTGVIGRLAHALPTRAAAAVPSIPIESIPSITDLQSLDRLFDVLLTAGDTSGDDTEQSLSSRVVGVLGSLKMPQPARQSLNLTAELLSRALLESVGQSEVHNLINRLERQLLKLSLRDSRFLEVADHPARSMVDLLEQYSIATDQDGRFFDNGLRRYLDQIVQRVVDRGDDDSTVYESARDVLLRLLAPVRETRARRVARLQVACESRFAIRWARLHVAEVLSSLLAGRNVPECVLRLMNAGWSQHLVLAAMRRSEEAAEFDEAVLVIDQLLEALDGGASPERSLGQDWRTLISRIESALARVSVDASVRDGCIEELTQVFAAIGRGDGPPTMVYRSQLPEYEPRIKQHPGLERAAARLRIGDWWLIPDQARARPMQLIWMSRPAGECAFASRSASDRLELSLQEFLRQVECGKIRPLTDQESPLLQRSEIALLDAERHALLDRALHDPVSGLPNRTGFLRMMAQIVRADPMVLQDEPCDPFDESHVVAVLEFDAMRLVWNACGMAAAEALTSELVSTVRACLGDGSQIGRLRDDSLVALLLKTSPEAAVGSGPVEALLSKLANYRFAQGDQRFNVGTHVGLAIWRPGEFEPEVAIKRANLACGAARMLGQNQVQIYEQGGSRLRSHETLLEWAGRIDGLLAGSDLFLRAQQIRPISDQTLKPYYEILLGVKPQLGLDVSPMSVVPAIERLGRSHDLDIWVIRTTLDWIEMNTSAFESIGGIAINLSPLSIGHPGLLQLVEERLAKPNFPPSKITFEFTETAAIETYGVMQEFIHRVRRLGCRFALDDFGSGYTSYAHLKNLPVDTLKIDGAFVKDILNSPTDQAMVKSMHDVARSLGMRTVAEYVETREILEYLRKIGIDYAQGYAIHKPCPIDDLVEFSPA